MWGVGLALLTLGSASAVIVRFRRARAEERQQIKWLAYAVGMFAVVYSSMFAFSGGEESPAWLDVLFVTSIAAIPVAIALAVIRYRLYDIDTIVRRTVSLRRIGRIAGIGLSGGRHRLGRHHRSRQSSGGGRGHPGGGGAVQPGAAAGPTMGGPPL